MADEPHSWIVNALINQDGKSINDTLAGTGHGGEAGIFDRLRFCHWAAPEWGTQGESAWVNAFQAAQLAISLTNSIIQGQIADMQNELAEGYYQQAKYKWDRFAGNYMPLEKAILWEAQSEPIREIDCDDDRRRANAAVISFGEVDFIMDRYAQGYKLCLDDTVNKQLAYARDKARVDTENYNLLDDNWFTDFKNDQRWGRRSNILNLGRNLGSIAMQYGDVARKLMGQVGDAANRAFGSLSQALGYYGTKFDTYYSTTYLAGTSTQIVNPAGQWSQAVPWTGGSIW